MAHEHPGLPGAGTVIEIDEDALLIVTSWTESTDITSEEVTGPADTIGEAGQQISFQIMRPVAVGMTYAVQGNVHYSEGAPDPGYEKLLQKRINGGIFSVTSVDQNGYGTEFEAFIEGFERAGSVPGLWTFSADMRAVTVPEDIEPGS